MTDTYHTAERLQLLALGYEIIPNIDKVCKLPGWNARDYPFAAGAKGTLDEQVARWPARFPDCHATGVRLGKGLGAIDLDVDDGDMIEQLMEELHDIVPEVAQFAPARYGGGTQKVALFVRVEGEPWNRIASKHFVDPAGKSHVVEIFGGAPLRSGKVSRQFGILGPHSHNEDGTVAREYSWATGAHLTAGPIAAQPAFSKVHAYAIAAAFERLARSAGWKPVELVDTGGASAVYDITEETRFDTDKGGTNISYEELAEELEAYGDVRCSASFMPGRGESGKRDRCWVYWSEAHGCVGVYVYGDEQAHLPAALDPARAPKAIAEQARQLIAGQLKLAQAEPITSHDPHADAADAADEPPMPAYDAALEDKVAWLLQTRAYYEIEHKVVRVFDTSLDCRVTPQAFAMRHRAWFELVGEKRKKPLYATEAWEASPARMNVEGVEMRPDQPFPLFAEGGRWFKNTYRRPVHPGEGGTIEPFLSFMDRFLPDEAERTWLYRWMAHKQRRPDIPGTAVIFVADNVEEVREGRFGTGRGLLSRAAHALYGPAYARPQSFNVLDGSSSQSAFTDWMHGSVLVTVDESRTSPTAHRRGERNAVYDVLKDIVDPAPKRMNFKGKYKAAFNGVSFCSFWVATNHADAVAIPAADRRFTVLRNGRSITPAEAVAFVAWLERPENIGALSRWLDEFEMGHFNMFEPLATAAKADMAELARTEVEDMLSEFMADDACGLVFTRQHLRERVGSNFKYNGTKWQGEFEAAWSRYCVKTEGAQGAQRRVRVLGTQHRLFCFRTRKAAADRLPEAAARREAAKWGQVDGAENRLTGLTRGDVLSEKSEENQ